MISTPPKRIGLLTGGGDCPGLNAVIRAVTLTAIHQYGARVIGIEDGFEGLVEGRTRELGAEEVADILNQGGTILGSSNKGDPWHYPVQTQPGQHEIQNRSQAMLEHLQQLKLDALITVGGDGTMHITNKLVGLGVHCVGVPKTIDNDLSATDCTFGFDSAVAVIAESLDRLRTTGSAHHRVMVVEVMGRYAGWLALAGGLAGGADVILLPELAFDWPSVLAAVQARSQTGKRFSMVCVAEGAKLPDGQLVVKVMDDKRTDARQLGGIGAVVAQHIENALGLETRNTVLGLLQRGGSPTAFDRNLASSFGAMAAHCACKGDNGVMVALRHNQVVPVPLQEAIAKLHTVPVDHPWIQTAKSLGVCFGDAEPLAAKRSGA